MLELQQVYFALLPNTQSLGVMVHFCNVSLGVHVSHHAAGMCFQLASLHESASCGEWPCAQRRFFAMPDRVISHHCLGLSSLFLVLGWGTDWEDLRVLSAFPQILDFTRFVRQSQVHKR